VKVPLVGTAAAVLEACLRSRLSTRQTWRAPLSWALYDWGNSAFATSVMVAVLPVYYVSTAARDLPPNVASAYWGYTTSTALLIAAVASPLLGAMADHLGALKRFMAAFVMLGTTCTAALSLVGAGQWPQASLLFVAGYVGFAVANVFYDALLRHVAGEERVHRLSALGCALGYAGGGTLLAVNVLWILWPHWFGLADSAHGARLSMLSVGVWWAIFSIPLFRYVAEPRGAPGPAARGPTPIAAASARLRQTIAELRRHRPRALFLGAFQLYSTGIRTIALMAAAYGTEVGIGPSDLLGALLVTQFLAAPCSLAVGPLARGLGARRALELTLVIYALVAVGGAFISAGWHFWALALTVATVQGGNQALSRSVYSTLVPRARSAEFFGFFSVSARSAGVVGPLVFSVTGHLAGSSRVSIVALLVFFLGGLLLLARVDRATTALPGGRFAV
jgi:UMF1 family MFS transporter